jgi:hypothetical protein
VRPDYPPEEGHYLRGDDYSPVAGAVSIMQQRRNEKGVSGVDGLWIKKQN